MPATAGGELARLRDSLAVLPLAQTDERRIDQLRELSELKAAIAAVEVRLAVAFADSQQESVRPESPRAERVQHSIASQLGLARRESPARTRRWLGWCRSLVADLPGTLAALQQGEIPEARAMIVARETGWLSAERRRALDEEIAPDLADLGDRGVEAAARRIGYRLDPHGTVKRRSRAEADRRVSVRPAPDAMAWLSALLPVSQAVAAYAGLHRAAETARASGDPRGRGQVMADTFVQRLTGQADVDAVGVEIKLIMTDKTLFGRSSQPDGAQDPGGDEPAVLEGYGPIPAELARQLVRAAPDQQAWIRRMYTDPQGAHLVAMDSRRRLFPLQIRDAAIVRDQYCRTPWCNAPIRHGDHVVPASEGGATSFENGQGLCEGCNYAKTVSGWSSVPGPGGSSDEVIITTPTGHSYRSRPPDLPGAPPRGRDRVLPQPRSAIGNQESTPSLSHAAPAEVG